MAPSFLTAPRPRTRLAEQLTHNAYVTDGKRLFRCLISEDAPTLILEDCQTLELILCSVSELAESDMRLVKAGDAAGNL